MKDAAPNVVSASGEGSFRAPTRAGFRDVSRAVIALALLFLAWQAADAILLIFAGLLFGVFLDTLIGFVRRFVRIGRIAALLVVCVLLVSMLGAGLTWSGYLLFQQWDELARTLTDQVQNLRGQLKNLEFRIPGRPPDGGIDLQTLNKILLPDPSRLFGSARSAFAAALGVLGSSVVVVLIGAFFAASPATYKAGVLRLVRPANRQRFSAVLDEMLAMLRWWLLGQLLAMTMIGISVWIALTLIGLPAALLLGTQAGLLNFIPYLGAFIAVIPILLAAVPHGLVTFAWAFAAYVIIQTVEAYIVTPLIQDRAVHLPPVATLIAIVLFGALFGAMGIAVATPFAACLRLAILRLYVEGQLERDHPATLE